MSNKMVMPVYVPLSPICIFEDRFLVDRRRWHLDKRWWRKRSDFEARKIFF
jgi:hypothetical protein